MPRRPPCRAADRWSLVVGELWSGIDNSMSSVTRLLTAWLDEAQRQCQWDDDDRRTRGDAGRAIVVAVAESKRRRNGESPNHHGSSGGRPKVSETYDNDRDERNRRSRSPSRRDGKRRVVGAESPRWAAVGALKVAGGLDRGVKASSGRGSPSSAAVGSSPRGRRARRTCCWECGRRVEKREVERDHSSFCVIRASLCRSEVSVSQW